MERVTILYFHTKLINAALFTTLYSVLYVGSIRFIFGEFDDIPYSISFILSELEGGSMNG